MKDTIKLRATNSEDLIVFSALVQDAVIRVSDISWHANDHRFVIVCNRYRWEQKKGFWSFRTKRQRVCSVLHFNCILSVKYSGFDIDDSEAFLNLLAIHYEAAQDNQGHLRLDFSAGATIRLHSECIDGVLSDVTESWAAISEPQHR
jgi:hypothetical protein